MIRTKDEAELAKRIIDRSTATAQVVVRQSREGADRRTSMRYEMAVRVTVLGDHNFYLGLTENLSEGGLFVQTQQLLPVGTALNVTLALPTSSDPVALQGVVRWVRSANAVRKEHDNFGSGGDEAFKPGMGIQFKDLTVEAARVIAKFITIRNPDFYA